MSGAENNKTLVEDNITTNIHIYSLWQNGKNIKEIKQRNNYNNTRVKKKYYEKVNYFPNNKSVKYMPK